MSSNLVNKATNCADLGLQDKNAGMAAKRKAAAPLPELETLSSRLKHARTRMGLTQTALAELLGAKDASQISRLESGERAAGVEAATVIRLARALGVPVGWLMADEGALPPVPVFRESTDRRRRKPRGD